MIFLTVPLTFLLCVIKDAKGTYLTMSNATTGMSGMPSISKLPSTDKQCTSQTLIRKSSETRNGEVVEWLEPEVYIFHHLAQQTALPNPAVRNGDLIP